jgi:hypothetical protein
MLAALATSVMAVVLASPPAKAATYTVTNTNDSGAGSLRQAILAANGSYGVADTIGFAPSLSGQTITLASELHITDPAGLTIDSGSANITVSGNDAVRLFHVGGNNAAELTLNNPTVANGAAQAAGGVYNDSGTLKLSNSTISENTATETDGGIYGNATLRNTIVANNEGSDCYTIDDPIIDVGYNLDSGATCGFDTANHSLSNTDPMLGPLADNGGPTRPTPCWRAARPSTGATTPSPWTPTCIP